MDRAAGCGAVWIRGAGVQPPLGRGTPGRAYVDSRPGASLGCEEKVDRRPDPTYTSLSRAARWGPTARVADGSVPPQKMPTLRSSRLDSHNWGWRGPPKFSTTSQLSTIRLSTERPLVRRQSTALHGSLEPTVADKGLPPRAFNGRFVVAQCTPYDYQSWKKGAAASRRARLRTLGKLHAASVAKKTTSRGCYVSERGASMGDHLRPVSTPSSRAARWERCLY